MISRFRCNILKERKKSHNNFLKPKQHSKLTWRIQKLNNQQIKRQCLNRTSRTNHARILSERIVIIKSYKLRFNCHWPFTYTRSTCSRTRARTRTRLIFTSHPKCKITSRLSKQPNGTEVVREKR
uniref:Uncharacterized protein n=1 Tax=Rhizophora mucronata TaxID=61149 RepID=A0A2P2M6R3_RHIMU